MDKLTAFRPFDFTRFGKRKPFIALGRTAPRFDPLTFAGAGKSQPGRTWAWMRKYEINREHHIYCAYNFLARRVGAP